MVEIIIEKVPMKRICLSGKLGILLNSLFQTIKFKMRNPVSHSHALTYTTSGLR